MKTDTNNSSTDDIIKEYLSKLVSFQTVTSDLESQHTALDWVADECKRIGLQTKRHSFSGVPSLIAAPGKVKKRYKVLLAAHIDVVPGTSDMFKLRERNGRYYGRGAMDMKFAIATYLALARAMSDQGNYDFAIMITSDEEVGGFHGAKKLVEAGYEADVCILPDGGYNWTVDTSSRGIWFHKLTANGKGAHGSRPWEGENALERMVHFMSEVGVAFGNDNEDHVTVAITSLQAGKAVNQIPAAAEGSLDIRYRSQEGYQHAKKIIDNIAKKHGIRQESIVCDPAYSVPADNPYLKSYDKLVKKHTGKTVVHGESAGGSDARFFGAKNIPVIVGAPVGGGHHGDDEWIDIASISQYFKIMQDFLSRHAKKS